MPKKKTSKKLGSYLDDIPVLSTKLKGKTVSPKRAFKNKKEVALALFLCLEKNDTESFVEILEAYLDVNKSEIAKRSNLSRSTVQSTFSRSGNPTLKTLAQVVHESVA